MEITAEVIHQEFYSAGEKALQEAKDILAKPSPDDSRAKRMMKLGFGTTKDCREVKDHEQLRGKSKELIQTILYFQSHYPNNKFITPEAVKEICAKYSLLLGDANNYHGEIPEKNLVDIENFKLREQDCTEQDMSLTDLMTMYNNHWRREPLRFQDSGGYGSAIDLSEQFSIISPRRFGRTEEMTKEIQKHLRVLDPYNIEGKSWIQSAEEEAQNKMQGFLGLIPSIRAAAERKPVIPQPSFKICAPERDFNTRGWEVRDGHILVWDPVVLQPVKNGYLIVTAWGPEAKDELVVNQKMN